MSDARSGAETRLFAMPKSRRREGPHRAVVGAAALTVLVICLAGCRRSTTGPSPPPASPASPGNGVWDRWTGFTDATAASCIQFTYRNGREADRFSILESLGGGVGLLDYDGDGWLDVFLPGGGQFLYVTGSTPSGANALADEIKLSGHRSALYRGRDGVQFDDASDAAQVAEPRGYTHGVVSADFDNDGFPDILVTGYGSLQLFHNQGDGTFVDVTESAGLLDTRWSTSAGWGDFDGDGNTDLYVVRYVDWSLDNNPRCPPQANRPREICSPIQFQGLPDSLYRNRGDGGFTDATPIAALNQPGKGLGLLIADLDVDGDVDAYVANDTTHNFLFRNDGHGQMSEVAMSIGVALDERGGVTGSMGVDMVDFNQDGLPDIGVANYDSELFALYRQSGGMFLHSSGETGIAAIGTLFVGWGTAFLDLELDGDQDLVVSNGHVLYHPENSPARQLPVVLLNHQGRFHKRAFGLDHYLGSPHHGRGLAAGDLNNDGAEDLVISHNNEPATVLLNQPPTAVHWLAVRLVGRSSNRDGIGARLVLEGSSGTQSLQVKGSSSYLSQCDRRVVFGLGSEGSPSRLTIYWPSGVVQHLVGPGTNRQITLLEPPGP